MYLSLFEERFIELAMSQHISPLLNEVEKDYLEEMRNHKSVKSVAVTKDDIERAFMLSIIRESTL